MTKRLLVMAGGTGGHVFPGLAVAEHLKAKGWEIHWLGTKDKMEAQIVPSAGFDISFIDVSGVRGNGIIRLLKAPWQILKAIFQALKVIKEFQPNVVLGMGGFASGPGGVASWMKGIPLVIHEQNAIPGFTNKLLSKLAYKILEGFPNTFLDNPKASWVGNPVRSVFREVSVKQIGNDPLKLLVVGGSLGALALNEQVPKAAAEIPEKKLEIRHQTGKGKRQQVTSDYSKLVGDKHKWIVEEFIEDMKAAYEWADVIVCRAGALTVAEVAASGRLAIFVPLPYAVDDHQTSNAKSLVNKNAAWLLPQKELESGKLKVLLEKLLGEPQTIVEMSNTAKSMAKLEATQMVANTLEAAA